MGTPFALVCVQVDIYRTAPSGETTRVLSARAGQPNFAAPTAIAPGPDGSLYFIDLDRPAVRRLIAEDEAEILVDLAALPAAVPEPLWRPLRLHNGAKLFDGALALFGAEAIVERNEDMVRFPWFRREPGWIVFARPAGHEILWAIDEQGIVHGLGCEELTYRPQAPLEQWLADQVADLTFAWTTTASSPGRSGSCGAGGRFGS